MVVAETLATSLECVLVQVEGCLVLAQFIQAAGEIVGRGEGVGVVIAECAAAAFECVLVEVVGGLVLAKIAQIASEIIG